MDTTQFATRLDELCDQSHRTNAAFKADVKALAEEARESGLSESEIRTQLGAKAAAMIDSLEQNDHYRP